EVWREGLEFGGAGIHALEYRRNMSLGALHTHRGRRCLPDLRQLLIACAHALGFAQQFGGHSLTVRAARRLFIAVISCNCRRNHGSIFVIASISFMSRPRSIANSSQWMRSGRAVASFS